MQFVVIGYDANDSESLNRRLSAREEHLKLAKENYKNGKLLFATGFLNEQSQMIRSNMIMEFDSKSELDEYLKNEPYVKGNVWKKIKMFPAKVAPFCLK